MRPGGHAQAVDLAGRRIGHLLVLRRLPNRAGRARWWCRCDCGRQLVRIGSHLLRTAGPDCGRHPGPRRLAACPHGQRKSWCQPCRNAANARYKRKHRDRLLAERRARYAELRAAGLPAGAASAAR